MRLRVEGGAPVTFKPSVSVCATRKGGGSCRPPPSLQSRLRRARKSITAATRVFMLINFRPFTITTSVPVIPLLHIVSL